jgi:hypothetical protein
MNERGADLEAAPRSLLLLNDPATEEVERMTLKGILYHDVRAYSPRTTVEQVFLDMSR